MKRLLTILLAFFLSTSVMANGLPLLNEGKSVATLTLTEDNLVTLMGAVNRSSAGEVIKKARELDSKLASNEPIVLYLYTPGGSINAGLDIIETLRSLNRPVVTVTSFAASMGFQIAQHLDERYILQYGTLMSHKASGGFSGEFGDGASQLDSRYGFWLRKLLMMDKQTVKRTNGKKTLEQYRKEYENELWLSGAESVENGYADQVVSIRCDVSLQGFREIKVRTMFGNLIVELSKCPLNLSVRVKRAEIHTNVGTLSLEDFLAKGGQFGQACISQRNYYSKYDERDLKTPICASNPNTTMDVILIAMQKAELMYTVDVSKILKMSFHGYMQEVKHKPSTAE